MKSPRPWLEKLYKKASKALRARLAKRARKTKNPLVKKSISKTSGRAQVSISQFALDFFQSYAFDLDRNRIPDWVHILIHPVSVVGLEWGCHSEEWSKRLETIPSLSSWLWSTDGETTLGVFGSVLRPETCGNYNHFQTLTLTCIIFISAACNTFSHNKGRDGRPAPNLLRQALYDGDDLIPGAAGKHFEVEHGNAGGSILYI